MARDLQPEFLRDRHQQRTKRRDAIQHRGAPGFLPTRDEQIDLGFGSIPIAGREQRQEDIEVCSRVPGLQAKRLLVLGNTFFGEATPDQSGSKIYTCDGMMRIEFYRLPEKCQPFVKPVPLTKHHPEICVSGCKRRVYRDCFTQQPFGTQHVATIHVSNGFTANPDRAARSYRLEKVSQHCL